ncbi:MAG: hypothetical protein Q9178_000541 [Gyalolechia marmorata]
MARTKQTARKDGKKKKKNAPDRPQPERLFPTDENNPALNPKLKSENETAREKKEWEDAIKFLQDRVHSAPLKPAPPKQLLTLIGAFLTSYGFNDTYRIYQLQCNARSKLDGWDIVLGERLPKGFPDLVKLYKSGLQNYEEKQRLDETSSSDGEDVGAPEKNKKTRMRLEGKAKREKKTAVEIEVEQTSSSGSSDDISDSPNSDIDTNDASVAPKPAKSFVSSRPSTSSPSAISTSDSDADDENEKAGLGASPRKPTAIEITNPLKRKKVPSVSSNSNSSLSEEEPAPKRAKKKTARPGTTVGAADAISKKEGSKQQASQSSSSGSSTSSSGSELASDSPDSEPKEQVNLSDYGGKGTQLPNTTNSADSSVSDTTSSESESENSLTVPKRKKSTDESKVSSDSSVTLVPTPTTSTSRNNVDRVNRTATSSSSSSSSSTSSSSSSDSELEAELALEVPSLTSTTSKTARRKASPPLKPLVDSAATIVDKGASDPTIESTTPTTRTIQKESKPKAVPFTRIPPNTPIPAALASNAYQPYDYAERAHQDLSITKGKGFTKEKNKKKRGSYRGGVIDVGPGRAIRFQD